MLHEGAETSSGEGGQEKAGASAGVLWLCEAGRMQEHAARIRSYFDAAAGEYARAREREFSFAEQKRIAQAYIAQLDAAKVYSRPIVTKVEPFQAFYPAESYHQDFLKNNPGNPYIIYNDLPKLENLKKNFPNLYQP